MTTPTRLRVLAPLAALLVLATAACSAESVGEAEDVPLDGDGNVSEDELVSEIQLNGSGMDQKHISLTFDDGPGGRTAELAEYLATEGVVGAFFINGKNVPGRQQVIDTIVGRGHTLANHTQNHAQMTRLSGATLISAVADTDATIKAVQPRGPFLLRAPYGAWNGRVADEINRSDMKKYVGSIFWDVGGALTSTAAADWDCWGRGVTVQRCADLYLQEIRTKKRGIVLMHDVHSKTVDMVKLMVPVLKREGFIFDKVETAPQVKRAIDAANGGGTTPPPPAGNFPKECRVTGEVVNVRATPEGQIVTRLNAGTSVRATAVQGSWYAVSFTKDGVAYGTAQKPAFMHTSLVSCP